MSSLAIREVISRALILRPAAAIPLQPRMPRCRILIRRTAPSRHRIPVSTVAVEVVRSVMIVVNVVASVRTVIRVRSRLRAVTTVVQPRLVRMVLQPRRDLVRATILSAASRA